MRKTIKIIIPRTIGIANNGRTKIQAIKIMLPPRMRVNIKAIVEVQKPIIFETNGIIAASTGRILKNIFHPMY